MNKHKRTRLLGVGLLAVLAVGCEDKKRSQVVVSMLTDINARDPLQDVRMRVDRFEDTAGFLPVDGHLLDPWSISAETGVPHELPGSFVLFSGPDVAPRIRVTLSGLRKNGTELVTRVSTFRLVPDATIFLRMSLTVACEDNADCPAELTCVEGTCRKPEIEGRFLPPYVPNTNQDTTVQCNSGTVFKNTSTKDMIAPTAPNCPDGEICVEGTCYKPEVFDLPAVMASQPLTIEAIVTNSDGAPVPNAQLLIDDGPLRYLRQIRTAGSKLGQALTIEGPRTDQMGIAEATGTYSALAEEVRVTAVAPGHAPQIVTIPRKPGVSRYSVPVVLHPTVEAVLGGTSQLVELQGGGRTAVVETGTAQNIRMRYALLDPRFAPGQSTISTRNGLLQAVALFYIDSVDMAGNQVGRVPMDMRVTLGTKTTPAVLGTQGNAAARQMDLQGYWRGGLPVTTTSDSQSQFTPNQPGLWAVTNHTVTPGCIRGRVVRADNKLACAGTRVRLLGPYGVSTFDSSGLDGSFCATGARQAAATLVVGKTSRSVFVPNTAARCTADSGADSLACINLGDVEIDAADCDRAPSVRVGSGEPGAACTSTLGCGPVASCVQKVCVGEGALRVTLSWSTPSDFDLHLELPSKKEIGQKSREVEGGKLDVEQCANGCESGEHVENIVFAEGTPPRGTYRVWVENFSGSRAPADGEIEVVFEGKSLLKQKVAVPAAQTSQSLPLTFNLP